MTTLDYAAIVIYALFMLAIGSYYARRVKNTDDYLLGGRSMSPTMVGLSLFATLTSTLTYLALPGEMIKNGPIIFAEFLSFPIVFVIVGWLLIPKIVKQHVTSGYALLEDRLGLIGRLLGAGMFIVLRIVWMASVLYATTTLVLIPTLNIDPRYMVWVSIALTAITLIYTVEGGLKAVVLTDAIQAMLMVVGAIATVVIVTNLIGFDGWWPSAWPSHWTTPALWPTVGIDRTIVGAFLNMLFWMTCTAGSDQMSIQRYLATRDASAARRSFGVQLTSNVLIAGLLGVAGLAVLGYFQAFPEELAEGMTITSSADVWMTHFIVVGLPPGMTGLVIAAILGAAMSSLSSGLNSASAVLVTDFVCRAGKQSLSEQEEVRAARGMAVVVGIVAVALSLVIGEIPGNLMKLCITVVNLLTSPIFVLFFLALFVRRASAPAAVLAAIASATCAAVTAFGWDGNWFLLSTPAGLIGGVIVGTLASWILPHRDPRT